MEVGGKCHHQNLHSKLAAYLHSLLPQREERGGLPSDCSLTYAGNNIYLPTSFCQALLQGHILAIPDPDAPTVLLPLLTPTYSSGPANAQQQEM